LIFTYLEVLINERELVELPDILNLDVVWLTVSQTLGYKLTDNRLGVTGCSCCCVELDAYVWVSRF